MIIDPDNSINNSTIHTDICVIGAGIAGLTFAREFLNSGREITVLESGRMEPHPDNHSLESAKNIGLPYFSIDSTRKRAFGGSSHAWHTDLNDGGVDGVRLRAMDALDFEKRDWVPYSGWPFSKSELDTYYSRAHEVFKIGPYRNEADFWQNSDKTPKLSFKGEYVETTIFQFARKNVFYELYRQAIEKSENIRVYLNSTAIKIIENESSSQIDSIQVSTSNGGQYIVKAKTVILAQGGLETPRLMMLSNDRNEEGVGNRQGLVGRFFMEHPHLWSGFFYPKHQETFKQTDLYKIHIREGVPVMGKLILSDEVIKREKLMNNTVSLHYTPMLAVYKPERALKGTMTAVKRRKLDHELLDNLRILTKNPKIISYALLRKLVRGDHEKWYRNFDGYRLNMMSEQAPDPESRVMLGRETDKFGQNKIDLKWKVSSSDIRSIRRFQEILDQEFRKSNLGKLDIELKDDSIPEDIHGGKHHMGTTRMNNDPNKGVVNENCKVHGIENLYIAGSAVFPTVGYANPTLTIAALSLRLADHIKKN